MTKRQRQKRRSGASAARTGGTKPPREPAAWETLDWKTINPIHDALLERVRAEVGRSWKAANGELHSPYLEMPFWIVLDDEADVSAAHAVFREIVRAAVPKIEPVQCTVSYTVVIDGKRRHLFLGTNAEILDEARNFDAIW